MNETGIPISKLSIIIPCFNEADTICTVLHRIMEVPLVHSIEKEVIIVNDCSTDATELVIREYLEYYPAFPAQYFNHNVNKGKGAAIHTGIAKATGDYLLIQDADLEYDPDDYNTLLAPIIKGKADVIYGSRFMGGKPHRILFFWHTIGNRILTCFSNALSNLNLTDMETGYKVFRTSIIQRIALQEKRFGFEPEITMKVSKVPDIKLFEVGIAYYGRTYKDGKKIRLKDAFRCVYCIVKYYFFPGALLPIPSAQNTISEESRFPSIVTPTLIRQNNEQSGKIIV